ncbi:hypothetical protein bas13_0067 [Escherichia phage LeonhardEuler]|uniref:Uncharacterized protein n=1 Tax=Escherichia phage LeonhardEuler TaxID=2851977 RepID=A0AAE7VWF5_9CAUD|nr:hypothetical protein bas13_0067 [Escherichia phage LeonhardEuler]
MDFDYLDEYRAGSRIHGKSAIMQQGSGSNCREQAVRIRSKNDVR